MNLDAAPEGHQTSSFISIFLLIITRKSIYFARSATKAVLQNLQGSAIRVCRGQGSHCKMKVFSIFTIGPRSSGGSGGMLPQKILKIRYPD